MSFYFVIVFIAVIILVMVGKRAYYELKTRPQQIKLSKQLYDEALKSGDKRDALEKGRLYYSWMRNGDLTIYDEQAISNDLSTMK